MRARVYRDWMVHLRHRMSRSFVAPPSARRRQLAYRLTLAQLEAGLPRGKRAFASPVPDARLIRAIPLAGLFRKRLTLLSHNPKAVVLCAGEGSRLRPLTFSKPKHLLPVAGTPILGHVLETLAAAGLDEVALVVGHRPEAVQRYVGDGSQWRLNVTYITQEQPLGLADAISQAREFVGTDPFIVYLGDNLLEDGISDFVTDFVAGDAQASLLLKEVEDPRRYGVVVLDDQQRVVRLEEKPADPPSNLAIVGVYAFTAAIFDAIAHTKPSARGELEITDAIQYLVEHKASVTARVMTGFWEDAGEPKALLRANRKYLDLITGEMQGRVSADSVIEGEVRIGKGTRIVNSRIVGPCLIGQNCVIENSTLLSYVMIGDGCAIDDSLLEDCLIQHNCRIAHLAAGLSSSVLGESVRIAGGEPMLGPQRMILGDMAQISPCRGRFRLPSWPGTPRVEIQHELIWLLRTTPEASRHPNRGADSGHTPGA